jgi:hypothetical protein
MSNEKASILAQTLKVTFVQENDCMVNSDLGQFLNIYTEDGGGGDYYVMDTERWAFDSIDDLIEVLNQFKEKHDKIK